MTRTLELGLKRKFNWKRIKTDWISKYSHYSKIEILAFPFSSLQRRVFRSRSEWWRSSNGWGEAMGSQGFQLRQLWYCYDHVVCCANVWRLGRVSIIRILNLKIWKNVLYWSFVYCINETFKNISSIKTEIALM